MLGPVAALGVLFIAVGHGARGPIAAFAVTAAAVVLVLSLHSIRALGAVAAAVVVGAVALPFVTVPDTAGERLREAANDPVATLRGDLRWILYDQATELIED